MYKLVARRGYHTKTFWLTEEECERLAGSLQSSNGTDFYTELDVREIERTLGRPGT